MASSPKGYTRLSILVHWLTAVLVVALFVSHEGDRGSAMHWFHVSFGSLAGIFLLWRSWYRIRRGPAEKPQQHTLLNLLSDGVRWGLMLSIVGLVITGYLLPWTIGQPIDFVDLFSIPSPLTTSRGLHEFFEVAHDLLGHLIVPLVLLHIAGALKHQFIDRDSVLRRMLKSEPSAR